MSSSEHAGKTMRCSAELGDVNEHGNSKLCDTELSYDEHGRFVRSPSGVDHHGTPLRERFEASALAFDCPECGTTHYVCPVCSDDDDNTPPGWFRGESSGEQLACHNCNAKEAARQRREPSFGRRSGRHSW